MVFEVNDSAHLQQTLERIVSEINKRGREDWQDRFGWDRVDVSGRTYYTLKSADFGVEGTTPSNGY